MEWLLRPHAPDSDSLALRRIPRRRRRTLRRQTALAFAPQTELSAQARTRGASAAFTRHGVCGRVEPPASRHRRSFDHHRPVAEGFERCAEISAPCKVGPASCLSHRQRALAVGIAGAAPEWLAGLQTFARRALKHGLATHRAGWRRWPRSDLSDLSDFLL